MPIDSTNTIATSYQTELVALRAAASAPYFLRGSKAYIDKAELVNKRKGQTYGFVIRDRGEVENKLAVSSAAKKNIVEREVKLSIEPWHIFEQNNVVESKTDLQFDKEVAEMDGPALIQGSVKKEIAKDMAKCTTAFVGNAGEFEPLAMASGHLASITSEPLYGFCDPMVQSIVTARGGEFVPTGAPEMYKQGHLGIFHGADYTAQRFLKVVKVPDAMATAMSNATFTSFNDVTNVLTIKIASAGSDFKVSQGTPFWVEGIVATDTLGDETAQPYAFIAKADVNVTSGSSSIEIPVDEVPVAFGGTRVASLEDGSEVKWADVATTTPVTAPAAGNYFTAIIRANGAYQFQTLDEIDVATPDSKKGSVESITVFQNRLTDMDNFETGTRFDLFTIAGTVEKRCQSLVLVKAK